MISKVLRFESKQPIIMICYYRGFCEQKHNTKQDFQQFTNDNDRVFSCNKSGLLKQHRNILHNKRPYRDPASWIHLTEKYQRKIFGSYGIESGVDPRICFSTNADKLSQKLFDDFVESENILCMIKKHKAQKKQKMEEIMKREEDISKKIDKLDQWKTELHAKIAKKEAEALAAKERKERLVEEVRRHFGYKVDPRDERFKEVLEQKEREDKKKQKEAKRKAKEEKLISKLAGSSKV